MPVKNELGRPTRTNSIFGTIKSILPSTFSWLKSAGNDTPTKRKGGDEVTEEEGRGNKRQKLDTPTQPVKQATRPDQEQQRAPTTNGYLDAPENFFRSTGSVAGRRMGAHVRSTSLIPSAPRHLASSRSGQSTDYRRTVRTQSMDPPARHRPVVPVAPTTAAVRKPIPLSRDISMDDETLGMTRSQSFQMRTSMTPQPMGQSFGPAPVRRERDGSEPPPLAQLIDKPIFVKAPLEPLQSSVKRSQVTLGSLAEAQRAGRPMQRSHSTLALDSNSPVHDLSTPIVINTTEKVLRELEAYKTPLLPTRLQGSTVIPEMFKTKKARRIALMHDREKKPRLGMADKASASEKSADEAAGVKPYAGRGGMKKLLARRQMEEEEEKEKERASAIETDEEEAEQTRHAKALNEKLVEELRKAPAAPEPERPRSFVGGREQSSLRVGRQRTSRNHIVRPQAKPRGGRFSAIYEDDDEDGMEEHETEREIRELEEAAKKVPTFNIPAGFSFAKDTAPLKFDTTDAKEPPVASLPFSFTGLSGPSTSSPFGAFAPPSKASSEHEKAVEKPASVPLPTSFFSQPAAASSPPITVAAESHSVSAPAPLTPLISAAPQIALVPPTPGVGAAASAPSQPASEQLDQCVAGNASSAVPNFFASSLTKSTSAPATPPTFSFAPLPASPAPAPSKEPFSLFGSTPKNDAPVAAAPSLFGAPDPSAPAVETPAATESKATPVPPSIFSGFGSSAPTSAFPSSTASAAPTPVSLSQPPQSAPEPAVPSPAGFSFAKPVDASNTPATTPFTFGVTKPAEPSAPSAAPSLPFSIVPKAASKEPESRPGTGDAAKPTSLFGPPAAPTAFTGFGTPSPSVSEPPKSPFPFGQASQAPAAPSTPTAPAPTTLKIETPKPLFGGNTGFPFGQPAAVSTPGPSKSPFTFGTTTAPATPTSEAGVFKFGAPSTPAPAAAAPAPGSLFGTPAAAPETPQKAPVVFGFGTSTPRQVTPPRKDDSEVMMDESPQRSITMDTNSKPDLSKITGFGGFNTNGVSSPFGQPAQSTGSGFPFNSGSAATTNPFGAKAETKPADKLGFNFGAASTTNGFNFGAQKAPEPPQAPTTNAFSFPPTPASAPSAGFGFSAPQMAPSTSFGSGTGSAAVSPSPFTNPAQPAGFNFTPTTATSTNNPFGFGSSQPASPAVANPGLPGQNGFAFGGSVAANAAAPASSPSPFTPSAPLPQSGVAMFTLGAAPPPNPGMAGRVTKKLPNRRGGKR